MARLAVLGVLLVSASHALSFKSMEFAKLPNQVFKGGDKGVAKKMKELQEQFGRATRTENKTQEEVGLVKNKVEEIEKSQKKFEEDVTAAKDEVKKMDDRVKSLEASLNKAAKLTVFMDQVSKDTKTHKTEIDDLKASREETKKKMGSLEEELGSVQEAVKKTQEVVKTALKTPEFGPGKLPGKPPGEKPGKPPVRPVTPALTTTAVPTLSEPDCPEPFTFMEETGQCFLLRRDQYKARSIQAGSEKCAELHERGSLAILNTLEKLNGAKKYLRSQGQRYDVLVGAQKMGGKYKWVSEEELGEGPGAGWCGGQPDPRGPRNCVSLWQGMGFCIDDANCDNKDFLCEVEPAEDYDERK